MSDNDTSAIDDKKNENLLSDSTGFVSNLIGFITSLIAVIIIVLLYFSGSGLILYICKLAQSNILPTETTCYPYTDSKPNIDSIKTNIFTTFTDPEMSMKLEFPYDEYNSKNLIIDKFREYKKNANSHFLANYFISVLDDLISFDYSIINSIMNSLNRLPEPLLVGLGPIFIGFLLAFMMVIVNPIYAIFSSAKNLFWFFKTNANVSGEGPPKWADVTFFSPIYWIISFWLVVIYIILFLFGFGFVAMAQSLVLFYCCITCLTYKSKLNDKNATPFTIIKDVLKYYKVTVVGIISFFIILLAFSKLGIVQGVFSIITLILVYWGIISTSLFTPISESNLTPVVSFDQAVKKCADIVNVKKDKHGFFYNFMFGQKGGGIAKDLKKIGKKLQN